MIYNIYDMIKKPLLTEKSNNLKILNKYSLVVSFKTNKIQIKKAIERIFNVNVISVNIINVNVKNKIFKGRKGKVSRFKKAIISIKNMQKIKFLSGDIK